MHDDIKHQMVLEQLRTASETGLERLRALVLKLGNVADRLHQLHYEVRTGAPNNVELAALLEDGDKQLLMVTADLHALADVNGQRQQALVAAMMRFQPGTTQIDREIAELRSRVTKLEEKRQPTPP